MADLDPLDLSNLQLTPDWLKSDQKTDYKSKGGDRNERDDRPRKGAGKGRGGPPRDRDGRDDRRGPRRDDARGPRRDDARGPRRDDARGRDSRGGGGARSGGAGGGKFAGKGGGKFAGKGGPRGGGKFGDRDHRGAGRESTARPVNGIKASIIPLEAGIVFIANQIKTNGRAYSVFDLARLILGTRDRYQIRFIRDTSAEPAASSLYVCKLDGSVWLSQEEAVNHALSSREIESLYRKEEVDTGAPKGNFTVIAIHGRTLLGPPNHHAYQESLLRVYKQRFSNMPFDRFKAQVRMERDEELIEKWKQQQSIKTHYFPRQPGEPIKAEEPPEQQSLPAEKPPSDEEPAPVEDAPSGEESPASEAPAAAEESTTPAEETPAESEDTPADSDGEAPSVEEPAAAESDSEAPKPLTSRQQLAAHFREHHAAELIAEVRSATISGNIPGRCVSQELLTLLRNEVEEQRRHPMRLVQVLCNKLGGQGLKFFKVNRKATYTSRARPQKLADDASISDQIRLILHWIHDHAGASQDELLAALSDPKSSKPAASKPDSESADATSAPEPEASAPAPEATTSETEAAAPETEAAAPETEAAAPEPEAAAPEPEAAAPEPEAAAPEPEAAAPEPEAAAPEPEAAAPQTDAPEPAPAPETTSGPETESVSHSEPAPASKTAGPTASASQPKSTDQAPPKSINLIKDLRWLVHEGFVIEFSTGQLMVAGDEKDLKMPPPRSRPDRKRPPRKRAKKRRPVQERNKPPSSPESASKKETEAQPASEATPESKPPDPAAPGEASPETNPAESTATAESAEATTPEETPVASSKPEPAQPPHAQQPPAQGPPSTGEAAPDMPETNSPPGDAES